MKRRSRAKGFEIMGLEFMGFTVERFRDLGFEGFSVERFVLRSRQEMSSLGI